MLTEEERQKKESSECQLLFTGEEWLKKKGGTEAFSNQKGRSSYQGGRGGRDKSKVRCFNCQNYGHFTVECRKQRRDKE